MKMYSNGFWYNDLTFRIHVSDLLKQLEIALNDYACFMKAKVPKSKVPKSKVPKPKPEDTYAIRCYHNGARRRTHRLTVAEARCFKACATLLLKHLKKEYHA